jgi:hypothetical protein
MKLSASSMCMPMNIDPGSNAIVSPVSFFGTIRYLNVITLRLH